MTEIQHKEEAPAVDGKGLFLDLGGYYCYNNSRSHRFDSYDFLYLCFHSCEGRQEIYKIINR